MIVYQDIGIAFPAIVLPTPDIDLSRWAVVACDQHTTNPQYWNEVAETVGDAPSTLHYIIPEIQEGVGEDEIKKRWHAMAQAVKQRLFVQYNNLSIITTRRFADGTVRYGCMIAIDLECYNFEANAQSIDCVVPTEATFPDKVQIRVAVRERAMLEFPHIQVLYDNAHPSWEQQMQQVLAGGTQLYHTSLMKGGGMVTGHAISNSQSLHQLINIITNTTSSFNPLSLQTPSFQTPEDTVYSDGESIAASALETSSITAPHTLHANSTSASQQQTSSRSKPILYVGDGNHALASAKEIWNTYKKTNALNHTDARTQFHPLRYVLVEAVNIHDSGLKFLPIHQVFVSDVPQWLHDIIDAISSLGTKHSYDDMNHLNLLYEQHPASSIVEIYGVSEQFAIVCTAPLPVVAIAEAVEPQLTLGGNRLFVHEWEDAVQLCKQQKGIALRMPQLDRTGVLEYIANHGRLPKKSFSLGHSAEKRYYLEGRFLTRNEYPCTVL